MLDECWPGLLDVKRDREMFFTSGCSCQDLISSASGTKANSHVLSQDFLLYSSMCFTRSNCTRLYRHLSVYPHPKLFLISALSSPALNKPSKSATMNRPKGGLASSNHDRQNPRDIIIFKNGLD